MQQWVQAGPLERRLAAHTVFWLVLAALCSETLRQALLSGAALCFGLALAGRVRSGLAQWLAWPVGGLVVLFLLRPAGLEPVLGPLDAHLWLVTGAACLCLAIIFGWTGPENGPGGRLAAWLAAACVLAAALGWRHRLDASPELIEAPAGALSLFLLVRRLLDPLSRAWWAEVSAGPKEALSRFAAAMSACPAWVFVCLAMLCALALDFSVSPGFQGSTDEGSNFAAAYHYLNLRGLPWQHQGNFIYDSSGRYLFDIAGCRLGLVLPATAVYWLGGGAPGGINLLYMGYHLALVAVVFFIGTRLFGRLVGILSAFAAAAWPVLLPFASTPWPETPMAMWSGMSFLLVAAAFPSQGRPPASAFRRVTACFVSGAALGCAYAIKESGLLFLPTMGSLLAYQAWKARRGRAVFDILAFAAGVGCVFAAETAILSSLFGVLTTKGSLLDVSLHTPKQAATLQGALDRLEAAAIQVRAYFPGVSIAVLALGAACLPFINPASRSLWFVMSFPALYLVLGSISLTTFKFPPLHGRSFGLLTAFAPVGFVFTVKWLLGDVLFGRVYAFAKPPAWLSGGCLVLACAVLFGLNVGKGYDNCRTPYNGRQYVSSMEALDRAKVAYPGYPLALADFLGDMLGPLFLGRPPAGVIYRNPQDKPPTKLDISVPCVLLAPLNKQTFVGGLDSVLRLGPGERATARILEVVQPPAGRVEEIVENLAKTVRLPGFSKPRPAGPFPTAIVKLDKSAAGTTGGSDGRIIFSSATDRLPLVGQTDNPVEQTANGVVVGLEPGKPRALTYSFFSLSSDNPPQCFLGNFSRAEGSFSLRLTTSVRNNDRVPLFAMRLHLYCDGRKVWSGETEPAQAPREPGLCQLSSPPGIVADAYMVEFTLKDIPPTPGFWTIENVAVTRD